MPFVPLPRVNEPLAELQERRRVERDERQRERLLLLELVASGEAKSRSALARQLGRNRESVSAWLSTYQQEGLAGLLRAPLPPGPASQGGIGLAAPVQAAIRARLARPEGERGYLCLWRWAKAQPAIPHSYSHFHRWVHTRLGASLKVARPSHAKKKRSNSSPSVTRA